MDELLKEDFLQQLNEAQLAAVTATEGYVRVIAGAGSGKTKALSSRFAFLVNEAGILPGNILCVTFTNKSANEMRERIHRLTGDRDTGYICTFHSFCVSVLQEDCYAVQYPKRFLVLDNADIDAMLRQIYEERGLTLRHMSFSDARDMIEMQKLFEKPDYYLDMIAMPLETLREKYDDARNTKDIIFFGYLYQEKKCFGLDYNDLIKFSLYIFKENKEIRLKWQKRLAYIMIDEFQDIDALQYELMEVLCGYHKNLFVVGDPDQTIYTWRGANIRYLLEFDCAFPGTETILMTKNYRSTPQILRAANALIAKNKHRFKKELTPVRPDGAPVTCFHAKTSEQEAQWIAETIKCLHEENGRPYRDITVLYRAHYLTRAVEEAFLKAEIPYTIYSGVQFFERREIKDALSYLRMAVYGDDLSFLRIANVPKRNLGERRMKFLQTYAETNGCRLYDALKQTLENPIFQGTQAEEFADLVERFSERCRDGRPASELLAAMLDESGYEAMLRTEGSQERLDNLAELKQAVHAYEIECGEECTPEDFLMHAALFANTDLSGARDSVRMMTVHSAKGLEFPCVFLCGMNEGIFPSKKTRTQAAMEEERRLAFVAVTRAMDRLYLSEAEGRNLDGSMRYPSRFLFDIGLSNLEWIDRPEESVIRAAGKQIERSEAELAEEEARPAYQAGDRIVHAIFGAGVILETDARRRVYTVQFDGMETPRELTFRVKFQRE